MTRFAVICPCFPSHAGAIQALTAELLDRGHSVAWLHRPDVHAHLRDERIRFVPVGSARFPAGSLDTVLRRAANPGGVLGLRRVIQDVAAATDMLCDEAPAVLRELSIDVVLADQMEAAGCLVAESLGLPYVSIACALPVNREPSIPLPVMPWGFAETEAALHRNAVSERVYDWLMQPHARVIERHGARFGLRPRSTLAECVSPLLQLSQTTAAFDFPRRTTDDGFHAVGPLRQPPAAQPSWDVKPVVGKPFVFASLGTLQGGRLGLFMRIARACRLIDAQLLIAHCGGLNAKGEAALRKAGATWVVDFAPQQDVIRRADLLITHGGMNTVMDGLSAGVPMLVLPIAFDQPGVAARVVHGGAGVRLLPGLASAGRIASALRALLADPAYKSRAQALGDAVRTAPGAAGAADLVERAVARSGPPAGAEVRVASQGHVADGTRSGVRADVILVGGGLAAGLIAWRLRTTRPSVRVLLLEAGDRLGGNHTWSFHAGDLTEAQRAWMAPLVAHRWPAHEVHFPGLRRRLEGEYCSVTSDRFHDVVHAAIADCVRLNTTVRDIAPTRVTLADGSTLDALAVIDARGPVAAPQLRVGYQKFLGQEVRTTAPHGVAVPLLMDATVEQHGGYRFVYVLPLAPDVLLIEDTCYADEAGLDLPALRDAIVAYAATRRWSIAEVLREEQGVLPIMLGGDVRAFWNSSAGVVRAGLAAALFHPTTGYSLPEAVAMAELVSAQARFDAPSLHAALHVHAKARWRAGVFYRALNRMLFGAASPGQRWRVMERFYRLDAGLISRFYAARLRVADMLRIVSGRPPVPLLAGCRAALDLRTHHIESTVS